MSYILDALKKSEHERAAAVDAASASVAPPAPHVWPQRVWPLAVASGLVAGAVVAVIMIWRAPVPDAVQATPAVAAPSEAAPLTVSPVAELPPVRGLGSPPAKTVAPKTAVPDTSSVPVATVPPPAAAPPPVVTAVRRDDAPFLGQKPVEFQRQLPELAITIHVYSPEESQRILFINNREFRRGDQVLEGLRVEEILPEGVRLSYRGESFKLRRPY